MHHDPEPLTQLLSEDRQHDEVLLIDFLKSGPMMKKFPRLSPDPQINKAVRTTLLEWAQIVSKTEVDHVPR